MQSCSFQHLLAGQIETNAAKTSQHIFKSQPRTNPEGFKHVFKMKHSLSSVLLAGLPDGEFCVQGGCSSGRRTCRGRHVQDALRFCGWPIAPHTAPGWDAQPRAGAALPQSAVACGFCPRGPACQGPVRASDVTAGLSRAEPAW